MTLQIIKNVSRAAAWLRKSHILASHCVWSGLNTNRQQDLTASLFPFLMYLLSMWHLPKMSSRRRLHVQISHRENQFGGLITGSTPLPYLLQQTIDGEVCRCIVLSGPALSTPSVALILWLFKDTAFQIRKKCLQHMWSRATSVLVTLREADTCFVDSSVHMRPFVS